ncbi:MAG: cation:proton antiporter, partial [Chryseobacterium sp.]|nr:cation:proton antiporter [Chryseobacterium sp.]
RWVAIFVPTKFMSLRYRFSPQTVKVLVWGGIRGGVSIALALSIPQNEYNKIIISITYCVVVFSIVVQGLTIGKVANPKKIATEEKILEEIH